MARNEPEGQKLQSVSSIDALIGQTPLLQLDSFADNLLGKVEGHNPYSVKDRIAREIVDTAERDGTLEPGGVVVEATSGNTGIGLAAVCAARGYDCILTMPSSMSEERRKILRALGAQVELTPADDGMTGANQRAEAIASDYANAILAQQFDNEANPRAHRQTTGPELWRATDGDLSAIVAGVGTGGTITGVAAYFKEDRGNSSFTAVAVEPADSPTLSTQSSASHDIQGIGPGFLPGVLRIDLIDEIRAVTSAEAKTAARTLGRAEGLLVGISSGAALAVAIEYANHHPDALVGVVLPDAGERYLSTDLYETD